MTRSMAARIMELEVRESRLGLDDHRYAYEAFEANGNFVTRGIGRCPSEAIHALVAANWKRVCAIVAERQGYRCAACSRICLSGRMEFDHILPRSKGRKDIPSNVRGLCGPWGCGTHREKHGG